MNRPILLVEDEPYDAEVMKRAFGDAKLKNEVLIFHDGAEVIRHLRQVSQSNPRPSSLPALVLLDLTMKRVQGIEVLRFIREEPMLGAVPVVVFTGSQEDPAIEEAYAAGGNAYVVKPDSPAKFVETVQRIGTFWARLNEPIPA